MSRRLIDATELEEIYSKNSITDIVTVGDKTVMQHLKDAPTIDAVELPCKIGDEAWCLRYFHGTLKAQLGIVSEMYFTQDMKLQIVVKNVGRGEWGEKIFPTYIQAQAEIERRKTT